MVMGKQIRDWLFVEDHVQALYLALTKGRVGENYNIGGNCEKQLEVLKQFANYSKNLRQISLITLSITKI